MNPSQILFGQHRPIIVWRRGVRARPRRTKEPSLRRACVFLVVVEYRRVIKNHQPINFVVGPVGASMGQKQIEGSLSPGGWFLIGFYIQTAYLPSSRSLAKLYPGLPVHHLGRLRWPHAATFLIWFAYCISFFLTPAMMMKVSSCWNFHLASQVGGSRLFYSFPMKLQRNYPTRKRWWGDCWMLVTLSISISSAADMLEHSMKKRGKKRRRLLPFLFEVLLRLLLFGGRGLCCLGKELQWWWAALVNLGRFGSYSFPHFSYLYWKSKEEEEEVVVVCGWWWDASAGLITIFIRDKRHGPPLGGPPLLDCLVNFLRSLERVFFFFFFFSLSISSVFHLSPQPPPPIVICCRDFGWEEMRMALREELIIY